MKVTYIEAIENHMAWRAKNYCAKCGAHEYDIVRISKVDDIPLGHVDNDVTWVVRCPQCGFEGLESPLREVAIARWQQC